MADTFSSKIVYKENGLIIRLYFKNGEMTHINISGSADLDEDEAIEVQHAINKFTGHI